MSDLKKDKYEEFLKEAAVEAMKQEEYEISPEAEEHVFSEEYSAKMQALFLNERKKERSRKNIKYAVRAAGVVLIALLCMGFWNSDITTAWKSKFLNFVQEIGKPNTDFNFKEKGGTTYSNDVVKLKYVPMGFELVEKDTSKNILRLVFSNGENYFQITSLNINVNSSIDTEQGITEKIKINNYDAVYTSNENLNAIIWSDDVYLYRIYSNMEKNELIKIAENVEIY